MSDGFPNGFQSQPIKQPETQRPADGPSPQYASGGGGGVGYQTVPTSPMLPVSDRTAQVARVAKQLYGNSTDWVSFFRQVLGVEGVVRKHFSTKDELELFEQSPEFVEIQQMVTKLRERNRGRYAEQEKTRVITVRMPESLHDVLRVQAHEKQTSMNKLCISKLIQVIDDDFIPHDAS